MTEITVRGLHKSFGDFTAVRESSFTIRDGEFFVMLGPSGCGKTTTLRMIAGLETPTSGSIFLDGRDVTDLRAAQRDIAFVFQLFALYPHMNVRQNISFPLRMQRLPRAEIRQRTEDTARLLRIDHLLDSPVGGLSSGDRQRVALGRSLVRRARAFLMDEPLGALDAAFRDLMREELRLLHKRVGATSVYVTHDQVEAMSMADRICIMDKGDILQIGTPLEIYERPATKFVAEFIGSPPMNFLAPCAYADSLTLSGKRIAGVRPEHIRIGGEGPLGGTVCGVEYLGPRKLVAVDTPAGRLKIRAANTLAVRYGEMVKLSFDADRIALFDAETGRAIHG